MLRFEPHPLAATVLKLDGAWCATTDKFSFLVLRTADGWETSWQDRYNGGSASSTREGPFQSLAAAEANCRRFLRELLQKN